MANTGCHYLVFLKLEGPKFDEIDWDAKVLANTS